MNPLSVTLSEAKGLTTHGERFFAALRMTAFLLVLAGCGRATPPDQRVQITYQTIETLPEQQAIHRKILEAFEQLHTNIHVNVVYDTSKFQKLNVQLAGGAAPDVFYYIVDRLPAIAHRGVVRDLTDDFVPLASAFYPEVVAPCLIDNKTLMMPFHFSTDVLFFNRDWFEKAGEPLPDATWDWQKFAEVADRLAKQRQARVATVLPRPLLLVQSFGATILADGKCAVNSPEALVALEFYRSLVARGIAPTTAAMGEMEAFDGVNLFRDQKIPLLVGRTYMLIEFDKVSDFRWDVAPVPKGKVRWSRLSVGGNCIWAGTHHPREAWEFVKFYSMEGAKIAASSRNAIPALKVAAEASSFPPVMLQAREYSWLDNPWSYAFWDEFNQKAFVEITDAVALGQTSPADALSSIAILGDRLLK
jgi:multiple sugar transport system substrate-binding protein